MNRVVVTGIGISSPIGNHLDEVSAALQSGQHGVRYMEDWDRIGNLSTRLAAPVDGLELSFARKKVRGMGRVALLSLHATEQAVADAGLTSDDLTSGRTGVSYGSTHGSSSSLEAFCRQLFESNSLAGLTPSTYIKFMSHTCAANLAIFYGIRGRIHTTCSACTSGSQGIGYGYEAIKFGQQDIMVCGGAEELHFTHSGVFDLLYATSTSFNDAPERSPRPFDADRDGLVVGEGAGTLILESYERARARGAHIHAEVLGYGTSCDGQHITSPSVDGMSAAMRLALEDARLDASSVQYINAHATATKVGDICESLATQSVYGGDVPISSTKGHTAHTLGACGAVESIFCLAMLRDGFVPPTRNLDTADPDCAALDYVVGEPRDIKLSVVASNNFAFGGINTSLLFGKV